MHDSLHPKLAKLNQRVEDMTGLTTKTAEPYQVVNYGIGGQFDPHFDFKEVKIFFPTFFRTNAIQS